MWRWIPLLLMALALPILGLLLLALFLWWLLRQRDKEAERQTFEIEIEPIPIESEGKVELPSDELEMPDPEGARPDIELPGRAAEMPGPELEIDVPEVSLEATDYRDTGELPVELESRGAPKEPAEPDDLKLIEGIGPKISRVLGEAGITTFALLAATEEEKLRQILEGADPRLLRLTSPASWPEQARLAAAGSLEALDELQQSLKGGRRVE